ncbi:hypothetical protein SAMN06275492_12836 [Dethiosulfovibrio salsuginis]|uniref:Uncharacterized protein n=1 Tax=Dethiosulfovibrio salsuginis TaxID=561720 RepID=A0A1X7KHL2_9BACT|nr:hypothetical protein SAMN06275492_12836 [Dethiosulfovibrio salsuginis]
MWFPNPRDYDSAEDYYRDRDEALRETQNEEERPWRDE